jgi:ribonuclease VapC
MFLDASAIVAIIVREADCDSLAATLGAAKSVSISPIAKFEAALAIARIRKAPSVEAASREVDNFLALYRAKHIDITPQIGEVAVAAFARFGKGRGRASLNMGDCFSYACAKVLRVPLLCKGDDFVHTDIKIA